MPAKGRYSALQQLHALQQTPNILEPEIEIFVTKTSQCESLY